MIRTLSPSARRALALAILAVLMLSGWSLVVAPLIAMSSDRRADIALLGDELGRLDALIARKPELTIKADALAAQLAGERGFWTAASAAAMAAAVQDRLRQAVTGSGGRLKSVSEVNEASEQGFRKISVRFSIDGPLGTIEAALAAVETATPALFVENMTITAPPESGGSPDQPPLLGLELSVSGYMQARS
jgi:general secretion pathway protein M